MTTNNEPDALPAQPITVGRGIEAIIAECLS